MRFIVITKNVNVNDGGKCVLVIFIKCNIVSNSEMLILQQLFLRCIIKTISCIVLDLSYVRIKKYTTLTINEEI